MVAFGAKEDGNQEASTSSFTPFKTSNGPAPPPLANSTPKKNKYANGLTNGGSPKTPYSRNHDQSNATITNGSLRKRKIAYMDEDEDEDRGQSLSMLAVQHNRERNGQHGKKEWKTDLNGKAKLQKISLELQEQRRNLPIAKGLLQVHLGFGSELTLLEGGTR